MRRQLLLNYIFISKLTDKIVALSIAECYNVGEERS